MLRLNLFPLQGIEAPAINGVGEDVIDRCRGPPFLARWGSDSLLVELNGDAANRFPFKPRLTDEMGIGPLRSGLEPCSLGIPDIAIKIPGRRR
jgi:hypothetical protein